MEDISHILLSLGEEDFNSLGAVVPPLVQTANFSYKSVAAMRHALENEHTQPLYTRGLNPTTELLATKFAALEGTEKAMVTASGSAAVAMAVLAVVEKGSHIVSVGKPYSWTQKLFSQYLPKFGIETTYVDGTDPSAFDQALQHNTALIYLETPNSFTFELQDLERISALAKRKGIHTIVDNSYCTGLYQKPADFGIDTVVHSATKHYSGHSDVVAGVICSSKQHLDKMFKAEWMTLGAIPSPFTSWLLLKSLRTLEVRMERSINTTKRLVEFLSNHPRIRKIHWPGHPSHAQYSLAQRQMKSATGVFSVEIDTDSDVEAIKFVESLKKFRLAVSWGGYESLIYPAVVAHHGAYTADQLPVGLCRISIGLESADVLIRDIENSLKVF